MSRLLLGLALISFNVTCISARHTADFLYTGTGITWDIEPAKSTDTRRISFIEDLALTEHHRSLSRWSRHPNSSTKHNLRTTGSRSFAKTSHHKDIQLCTMPVSDHELHELSLQFTKMAFNLKFKYLFWLTHRASRRSCLQRSEHTIADWGWHVFADLLTLNCELLVTACLIMHFTT